MRRFPAAKILFQSSISDAHSAPHQVQRKTASLHLNTHEPLPDIEEPQISVANFWRAAAPEEMESNIIEPQENVLRNTPGLTSISSFIGRGQGFVNLTFAVGTDMQIAKLNVINNLTQAPPRPIDAMQPQVSAGGGPQTPGAASLLVRVLPDNPNTDLASYQKLIEDEVQPRLARIPGVSQVFLAGEQPREVHITFDSYRAAALGIQINDIISTVSRATDSSGGFADVGRRQVRTGRTQRTHRRLEQ